MDDEGVSEARERTDGPPSTLGDLGLYGVLKDWYLMDAAHCGPWKKRAKENFDFVAGDMWDEGALRTLKDDKRQPVTFNRVLSFIKAVAGIEINGRHETVFLPRGTQEGDVIANELLTQTSKWMADTCDAEDEQSDAFQDTLKCGMGWTEPRLDYEDEPDGKYIEAKIDPLEMVWDRDARGKNLHDARRVFRVRKMQLGEARALADSLGNYDIADDELNAEWATGFDAPEPAKPVEERRLRLENSTAYDDKSEVHVVHAQWVERQCVYRVAIVGRPGIIELSDKEEFEELKSRVLSVGMELEYTKQNRKVYMQAFLGGSVIAKMPTLDPERFTFQCITGELHKSKGTWFGLVDLMRDPQMFANKWVTQALHILNTTAKGGVIAERGVFKDIREAQRTYARPDAITVVEDGAIQKGRIMQKPGVGLAAPYIQMMDIALKSIPDSTGINLEIMGLRDANQAGVLEAQRKQAGMTILATLFDSLRRYRKNIGRIRLFIIQNYIPDGTLIRLLGPDKRTYKAIALTRDKTLGQYDVEVDDAPTSPNQKEQTFGLLMQLLPAFREYLTPETALIFLEHSPLPSAVVQKFRDAMDQPNPDGERQKQIAITGAVTKIKRDQAASEKDTASASKMRAEGMVKLAEVGAQASLAELNRVKAAVMRSEARQGFSSLLTEDDYAIEPMAEDGLPQLSMPPSLPARSAWKPDVDIGDLDAMVPSFDGPLPSDQPMQ